MKTTLALQLRSKETIRAIVFDVLALFFIYLVPTISHMLKLPVYFIEPMRLALIIAMLYTTKRNAYIIALTLPVFSFLISAHPVVPKMLLITAELSLNVFLFYLIYKRYNSVSLAIFTSIILSKGVYYLLKLVLISSAVMATGLVGIPIYVQVVMTVVFTGFAWFFFNNKTKAA